VFRWELFGWGNEEVVFRMFSLRVEFRRWAIASGGNGIVWVASAMLSCSFERLEALASFRPLRAFFSLLVSNWDPDDGRLDSLELKFSIFS
jgi:hypothetical protein